MALITKIKTVYLEVVAALGFTPENLTSKGQPNGYAGLDAGGKVPSAQLPSYVDDVLEFANLASFPTTGTSGVIYLALDTNIIYRWSGSTYIQISSNNVLSVFGRTGAITPQEGDYSFTQLSDVNLTSPTVGQIIRNNGTAWANWTPDFLPKSGGTMTGNIAFAASQPWPTFNQNTTGNSATATALQTARAINGVAFNGTANITLTANTPQALTISGPLTGGSFNGGTATTLGIQTATGTQAGALSGADWTTFNNKQAAISLTVTGSSGAATFASNTLNVPTYTLSGLGGISASSTDTLTNKTLTDSATFLQDDADNSKKAQFQLSSIATATTRTYTLPNVDGTLVTTGDTGTVTNTMLTGSIADTKLDTISTAGKVVNSATTATDANTASAIIARDASGDFSASTATLSDQLVLTRANNAGTGPSLGQLCLNGAVGNRIDFSATGVAAPNTVTRSVGTKIVLYPNMGTGNVDYGIGVETLAIWQSVPLTTARFKWYAGTTQVASLTGTGVLTASSFVGSLNGNASTATTLTGGNADFYTNTLPANTGGTDTYMYVGRWTTTQTQEKLSLKILYNNSLLGDTRRSSEYTFFFNTSDGVDFTVGSTGNFYGWGRGFTLGEGGALDTANTRVVQVSNTQYDIYVRVLTGVASGNGAYVINTSGGSWTHSGTNYGSTTPTGNTYILNLDNILTNYMNATFDTVDAIDKITAAKLWDAANNQPAILMAGDVGSRIEFQDVGLAIPAVTTRSVGTKIVTRPTVAAAAVDFAIGATNSSQWYSVDTTSSFHTFYTGTTVSLRNGNSGTSSNGVVYEGNSALSAQNTAVTLTIAQLLRLVIQSDPATNITFTLPTGTSTDSGVIAGLETLRSFTWSIVNIATGFTITIAGNTGNAYIGNTTIAANTSATFRTQKTAANTFKTVRI